MQSKKINELGTNVSPSIYDLTVIGDPSTGQLKKITLNQIASLFGSVGGVSSVAMTVPTGLTVTGSPITTSGTLAVTLTAGYSIPTTAKQSEWDTGYAERLKWDGGASGLSAPTARTSLGLVIGTDVLAYRTFGSAANNNTGDFATAAQGVNADTAFSLRLTGASVPLSISSNVISIAEASTTISGFLSSTNFNIFNGKQAALNGTGFVKATGTTISYDNTSYLPLTGGILTGSLTLAASVVGLVLNDTSGSAAGSVVFQNNGTQKFNLTTLATSNNFALYNNGGTNSFNLIIEHSSGNATFSNSVTATRFISSEGNSASSTKIEIRNTSTASTTTKTAELVFQIADTVGTLKLAANVLAIPDGVNVLSSALSFGTNSDGSAPTIERMRITSGGLVGIGTDNPETLLHINKAASGGEGAFIFLDNSAGSALGNKSGIRFGNNTGASFSNYDSYIEAVNVNAGNGAASLTFGTWNGASRGERMRITYDGNILVSTIIDNGQGKLQVNGAITATNISYTGEFVNTTSTTLNTTFYKIIASGIPSGQTYTLPSPTSNNLQYVIINKSAYSQTISAGSGFTIYDMAGLNSATITLASKARCYIIADGSSFYQIF